MMAGQTNRLRIIGGRARGRRLQFPDRPGLRPTPDRVRETLFNWLTARLAGARCLDLFAGSGALGFEAASRGCASVAMVERSRAVACQLEQNAQLFAPTLIDVHHADALDWLQTATDPFDLVFLDPPYDSPLLVPAVQLLAAGQRLADGAQIYIECARSQTLPPLPTGWDIVRERVAGQVRYALIAVETD